MKDNLITNKFIVEGLPEKFSPSKGPNLFPNYLTDELTRRGLKIKRLVLDEALFTIADENRFNPVEDMLLSATWDGEDRIKILCEILGITDEPHSMSILSKWLHQTVAMALNDEADPYGADGVLVLQGDQGTGKTMFCRKLAMRKDWFAEGTCLDPSNKDSIIAATSVWINELGELDSTFKKDQSMLKAFITRGVDTYRMPYAREAVSRARRTSFCGTVNPEEFLIDDTGSRRYWVIKPKNLDLARLKGLDEEFYKKLWRQVYETLYLPNPHGFHLDAEEQKALAAENEMFSKKLPGEVEMIDKFRWDAPMKAWTWNSATDIKEQMHLYSLSSIQIGKVLTKLCRMDKRIEMKEVSHKKLYHVPPVRAWGMNDTEPLYGV